jgi:hypothetical protein
MALSEAAYEFMEGLESESEAAEGRAAPKRPSSQPSFRPRPAPSAPNYVTQTQLEAALARSDGKIKTVADGVATINARLAALAAASKKEADERKKSVDTQGKDVNQKLQMLALLPLLVTPPVASGPVVNVPANTFGNANPVSLPVADNTGTAIKSIAKPDKSTLDALLPLLLVSGMGGPGGLSLGGDSSGDSSMMMMALVLAMSSK